MQTELFEEREQDQNGRKTLIVYLTKYVAKNDIEFYRLPWHCSRDISRLFTSINFTGKEEEDKYFGVLPYDSSNYTEVKKDEYFNSAGFKFTPNDQIYDDSDLMKLYIALKI